MCTSTLNCISVGKNQRFDCVCVVLPDRNKVYKNKWIKLETVGRENMNMTWPFKQVTQGDQVEVQNLQLLQALSLKFPKQLKHHRAPTDPPKLLWSFRPMGDLAYIEQKYWPHVGCFVTLPTGPALEEQCNNKAIRFVGVASITSICLRSGTYILCKLDLFIEFHGLLSLEFPGHLISTQPWPRIAQWFVICNMQI